MRPEVAAFLRDVHRHNTGSLGVPARLYGSEWSAELQICLNNGWVVAEAAHDPMDGDVTNITITPAGRAAAGIEEMPALSSRIIAWIKRLGR